jgi:hypothetical protein
MSNREKFLELKKRDEIGFQQLKKRAPSGTLEYIEAIENGTLPNYYLVRFLIFKNNYRDDLPKEDVRNLIDIDENGKWKTPTGSGVAFKCQGNYILGLRVSLVTAVDDLVITDPSLIEEIDTFTSHKFNYYDEEFTSQEEIDMINKVLDLVIEDLSEEN